MPDSAPAVDADASREPAMSQDTPPPPPPGSKPTGSTGPAPTRPGPTPPPGGGHPHRTEPGLTDRESAWAAGGTVFGGMLLAIGGVMAVLEGIVGLAKDSVYVSTRGYTYRFDVTAWGWIHLIVGAFAVLVGLSLLRGDPWSRWAGIVIAGLSMIANFMFLPYQPVWSVVLIAIDIFVIWALATYHPSQQGRTAKRAGGAL